MWVIVFTLVLLGFCWRDGDIQFRTKVILTVLFVASWVLLFLQDWRVWFIPVQCALAAIMGFIAFGMDFLTRERW
jgi:hypothetical protein